MTIFLADLTKILIAWYKDIIIPRIITQDVRLFVIGCWLNGESREDIAKKHRIGTGTVYNIVEAWANAIGVQRADTLRELAINLKKNGLSVIDCAKGLRTLVIFKKNGINDDDDQKEVIYFLKEIYTQCQEIGFTPQQIFAYISDILEFSSEVSISQIPRFMKKRTIEKVELEITIQELSKNIDELTNIQEEKDQEIQRLSKIEETMTKTYKMFMIAKSRLGQYGIVMDDMNKFVNSVVGISKENYDPIQTLAKIADHEKLEKNSNYYKEEVNRKKNELAKLNEDISVQEVNLSYLKIKGDILDELERRGFGIKELKTLINMLNEIGLENNIDFAEIREKFFDDVKNYEEVIGSRMETDRLKNEIKSLEVQTMNEREKYNAYPKVIESIIRLSGVGISEDDIVKLDKILSMTEYYLYKDKPMSKKTLIDDLQKYGSLKLAIRNLQETEHELKSKKRTLDKQTNKKESDTINKIKKKTLK